VELVARLSDRPSAERDVTFLFRMATARAGSVRPMLEGLVRGAALEDETSVRAALHLCRDYGQAQHAEALARVGKSPRKDALRGLAAAALYDCGQPSAAWQLVAELERSRHLPALGWTSLVRAAAAGARAGCLVSEQNFRRVQQGCCE
jgi:predicted Zn-dependent protease